MYFRIVVPQAHSHFFVSSSGALHEKRHSYSRLQSGLGVFRYHCFQLHLVLTLVEEQNGAVHCEEAESNKARCVEDDD